MAAAEKVLGQGSHIGVVGRIRRWPRRYCALRVLTGPQPGSGNSLLPSTSTKVDLTKRQNSVVPWKPVTVPE